MNRCWSEPTTNNNCAKHRSTFVVYPERISFYIYIFLTGIFPGLCLSWFCFTLRHIRKRLARTKKKLQKYWEGKKKICFQRHSLPAAHKLLLLLVNSSSQSILRDGDSFPLAPTPCPSV
jgi:hypothetical protein